MITNERQYRITRAQLNKIKSTIDSFNVNEVTKKVKSKQLAQAELAALQSEFDNLFLQLQEYEALKAGVIETLKASTLKELPRIIIRARIVKKLSQKGLADLVGLKEQQIQKYEAEEYAYASLNRLAEIADALELNITEVAEFRKSQKPLKVRLDDLKWNQFPIEEMYRRNWFEGFSGSLKEALENSEELVKDFITTSLNMPIRVAARQRIRSGGTVNRYALIAWQYRLIFLARKMDLKNKFKSQVLSDKWFTGLAELSRQKNGPLEAVKYLENSGIRLIVLSHLNNTYLDGAALLFSSLPIVGMTLRYDRIDNFWFVLFHELVHIKRHLCKEKFEIIFDDLDAAADEIEKEADEYAGELLIPEKKWETALPRYIRNKETIIGFANEMKVNPAIVAGKIRREIGNYAILTDMVGQNEVKKLFAGNDFSC